MSETKKYQLKIWFLWKKIAALSGSQTIKKNKTENLFSLQDDETTDNILKPYFKNGKEPKKNSEKLLRTLENPRKLKGTNILWITSNLVKNTYILLWTFEMPYDYIKDNEKAP